MKTAWEMSVAAEPESVDIDSDAGDPR